LDHIKQVAEVAAQAVEELQATPAELARAAQV
jgi:hypothetical protein